MIIPVDELKRVVAKINWRPRHWAHIVVAVVAGVTVAYDWYAPIAIAAIYCTYQIAQMWSRKIRKLKVDGHKDIAEFAYFFVPTYVICLILYQLIRVTTTEMIIAILRMMR